MKKNTQSSKEKIQLKNRISDKSDTDDRKFVRSRKELGTVVSQRR